MAEAPFDVPRAHRWFAIELNNLAWDLIEAPNRSAEDTERMVHAAHGACFHWLQVGTLLNHVRAQCLLASAYAAARLGEAAVRHAERCLALSREAADELTTFDRATVHGCASSAYRLAGRLDAALDHHATATGAAAELEDAEDRAVFERLYPAP